MITTSSDNRRLLATGVSLIACACTGMASAQDLAEPAHEHDHGAIAMSGDEHAAHRTAADNAARYAVTMHDYAVPDVTLVGADGAAVELRSLLDSERPLALNFIFTTCTTICPVMTATFAQMQRRLGDAADGLDIVSISIDPEYDRPETLRAYAAQFQAGDHWTFLTGDGSDIVSVLRSFDTYAGSKMNHQPATFLKVPGHSSWIRIDGLASADKLAQEVTARLLN